MPCLSTSELREGLPNPTLELHLDECAACRRNAAALFRGSTPSAVTAEDSLLIANGELVGRYVVLGVLGAGASAVVYAGYDPQLDRKVALKVLRPGVGAGVVKTAWAGLGSEAQTLASLKHPNIVVVHDVGLHQGQTFFAMDCVECGNIGELLKAQARPWRQVLACGEQAGRGLAAAHASGIVHRDFKPANVLIGADGSARVSDFGLAHLEPGQGRAPSLVGTPAYMAPEQLDGQVATPLSDQFAFCVTFWEALSGSRPFSGENLTALRLSMTSQPALPWRSPVPLSVWKALRRGLSEAPADRYPTVGALLIALDVGRTRRVFARRVLVALAAVAALVIGSLEFRARARRAECDQVEAVRALWSEESEASVHRSFLATGAPYAERGFQTTSELLRAWRDNYGTIRRRVCEATVVRREQSVAQLQLRMACLERRRLAFVALHRLFETAEESDVEHAIEAASRLASPADCEAINGPSQAANAPELEGLYPQLARVHAFTDTGRDVRARDLALALTQTAADAGAIEILAETEWLLGATYERLHEGAAAEQALYAAIAHGEVTHNERVVISAWVGLMRTQGLLLDKYIDSHRSAAVAKAMLTRVEAFDLKVSYQSALGATLRSERRLAEAEQAFQVGLSLLGPQRFENEPEFAVALSNLALIASDRGRLTEALRLHGQSLEIHRRVRGNDHPITALELYSMGVTQMRLGRYAEALTAFQEALSIRERAFGPDAASVAYTANQVCSALDLLDRSKEALPSCQRAVDIAEKLAASRDGVQAGDNGRLLVEVLSRYGYVSFNSGSLADAEHAFLRSIELVAARRVNARESAPAWVGLGLVALERGRPQSAIEPLERAMRLQSLETDPPVELADNEWLLGRALLESKRDLTRARELIDRAKETLATQEGALADSSRKEIADWEAEHPALRQQPPKGDRAH